MPGRLAVLRSKAGPAGRKSLLVGSGTSRHAAEIAAAWFREAGLSASVSPAGEIHGPLRDHGCDGALIAVTQSGATGSVLRLLDQAKDEGIFRVVVTNEAESPAAGRADLAYVTRAGTERAIPATKSFTAALLALSVFGREWAAAAGADGNPSGMRQIREAPGLLRGAIEHGPRLERFVRGLAADRTWFFLGGGPLLPLAAEGALKMMETAVVPAIALRTEELVHGPFALVDRETPVVLLSEPGGVSPGETRALAALAEAGAPLLRLATEDFPEADGEAGCTLVSAGAPWLRPFEAAPVLQLLAFFAGRQLGRDVDAPAGLQKAVRDD